MPNARRFSIRPGALLALLLTVPLASASRADLKLDATVGFDNNYRVNAWTPLSVSLTGTGMNASADLQLVISGREGVTTYTKPLRLHAGPVNEQHTLYYFHPASVGQNDMVVQVVADGRNVAQKRLERAMPVPETQPVIVALTPDRSGLSYLYKQDLGREHVNIRGRSPWNTMMNAPGNPSGPQTDNPVRVLYPALATLPESANGYDSIDAIMLGDVSLDSLTDTQWKAIVQWVRDGGELIVSGSSDLNRLRSEQLSELLPVTPTGVKQVGDLPALSSRYEDAARVGPVAIVVSRPHGESVLVCVQGDVPLVAYRRVGSGVVVSTAFDLTSPAMRAWPGEPSLWQELMRIGTTDVRATHMMEGAAQSSWYGNYRQLADALAGIQSTGAPSFTFIGLFLLAYIICLVPVNYYLLRKRDRKELAWITAPAIVLVFSTGAYAIGYSVKGGSLFLRYGSVIEGSANQDSWQAYTISSIFSPRQTRYDVSVTDPAALATEVTMESGPIQAVNADLAIEEGRKTTVREALVNMWDHRNFAFLSHIDLGGQIAGSVVPESDGLRVEIINNTPYSLSDCGVSYRGQSAAIGVLDPGMRASRKVAYTRTNSWGRLGPVSFVSSGPPGAAGAIKQAMAANIGSNQASSDGNDPLLFTGWFENQVNGLELDGEHPRVEGVNLLAVHLPVPNPGGAAPPRFIPRPPSRRDPFARRGFNLPAPNFPPPRMGGGYRPQSSAQQGTSLYYSGRYSAAEQQLRAAIAQNPSDAQSFNMLAYALADQGKLAEALKMAQKANLLSPTDANIQDTVADMHQRRREYKLAAQWYVSALGGMGAAPAYETHEKYGETLLALGRRQEAVSHLQRAAMDYGSKWGARARAKLQSLGVGPNGRPLGPGRQMMGGAFTPPVLPRVGSGSRRIAQPAPGGGTWITIQKWSNGSGTSTTTYVPPGGRMP